MVSIDAIFVYSPEKELEILASLAKVGDKVDWKPAIILSATYLEKFGIQRLKRYFEKKKIKLSGRLERFSLPEVAILLYGNSLIPEHFFTQMNQIWKARGDMVHTEGKISRAYVGEEANKTYGRMLEETLKIIEYLKTEKGVKS